LQYENFGGIDIAYAPVLDFWSKENPDGASFLPRWKTAPPPLGNIYQLDGSYLRLKNVELSYTFSGDRLKGRGISSLKFYLNGNNLAFWSKLPNDFEQWAGGNVAGDRYGVYPTSSRINLGFDIKF
jgi:hypothetical protein